MLLFIGVNLEWKCTYLGNPLESGRIKKDPHKVKSIADSLVITNVVTVPALVSVVLIQKVREAAEVATTHRVLPQPEDDPLTPGRTVLLSHRDVRHAVKLELALTKTLLQSHKISTSITMIFI